MQLARQPRLSSPPPPSCSAAGARAMAEVVCPPSCASVPSGRTGSTTSCSSPSSPVSPTSPTSSAALPPAAAGASWCPRKPRSSAAHLGGRPAGSSAPSPSASSTNGRTPPRRGLSPRPPPAPATVPPHARRRRAVGRHFPHRGLQERPPRRRPPAAEA
uniref:Uncharacterized protein n=1 Tax=Setaria viridis TaxID=4556 RepID=A0A4U6U219_SETVI|nr:hypothetical protein SEVIR_6G052000v2 [Setaria viridis]